MPLDGGDISEPVDLLGHRFLDLSFASGNLLQRLALECLELADRIGKRNHLGALIAGTANNIDHLLVSHKTGTTNGLIVSQAFGDRGLEGPNLSRRDRDPSLLHFFEAIFKCHYCLVSRNAMMMPMMTSSSSLSCLRLPAPGG